MPAVAVTKAETYTIFGSHSAEKEVLMQRRRRGRFEVEQVILFHPQRVRPAWIEVPLETREEVTRLLARMLINYQIRQVTDGDEEVRHD